MTRKKAIFFYIICTFLALSPALCQPRRPPNAQNYSGRKMMPLEQDFAVIGAELADDMRGGLTVKIFFSEAVDARSVTPVNIAVNGRPLPPVVRFLFAKSRRAVMFKLPMSELKADGTIDLEMTGIKSFDGREAKRVVITELKAEEKIWLKSL